MIKTDKDEDTPAENILILPADVRLMKETVSYYCRVQDGGRWLSKF